MSRSLRLSAQERADLVAFLRTLSTETAPASANRPGALKAQEAAGAA